MGSNHTDFCKKGCSLLDSKTDCLCKIHLHKCRLELLENKFSDRKRFVSWPGRGLPRPTVAAKPFPLVDMSL